MVLGSFGVLSIGLRRAEDRRPVPDVVAELEELGYGTAILAGHGPLPMREVANEVLTASTRMAVMGIDLYQAGVTETPGTWVASAPEVGRLRADLAASHGDRFLVSLGASYPPDGTPEGRHQEATCGAIAGFLETLDAADPPMPAERRLIKSLGPTMLELAGSRALGALTVHVPPRVTAEMRDALGPEPTLAVIQVVVLEDDPARARAAGREVLATYAALANYADNFRRIGYGERDLVPQPGDRFVDDVVAWGDVERVAGRLQEHHDAGADHVSVFVVPEPGGEPSKRAWRLLAAALR